MTEPISRGTKIVFALILLFAVLIGGGSVTANYIQVVQNNQLKAQLIGAQNASDRLLRQYCNSINAYKTTTGKTYVGSTCDQATNDAHSVANAGAQGPQGVQGRGIAELSCTTAGQWRVVYTDNTSATINGSSCRTTK